MTLANLRRVSPPVNGTLPGGALCYLPMFLRDVSVFPLLWTALLLLPLAAIAQVDPDASLPDASVGQGGADQSGQEGDDSTGRVATDCRSDLDCDKGFACQDSRCVYVGTRKAGGCGGGTGVVAALGASAFLAAFAPRRKLKP